MSKCDCSRREFLVQGSKVVAALGVATYFVNPTTIWSEESEEAPKLLTLNITDKENEKLKNVGGAVFVKNPTNKKEKIIIYREKDDVVKAFKNYCTHKGGPIKAPNKDGLMVCEWHKAKFDLEGKVSKGPAKENLEVYDSKIDGDVITITL